MMNKGVVLSINMSEGGVPKWPITDVQVSLSGLQDDRHNDRNGHGGGERAVCLYGVEIIEALQSEGHPISVGTTGENLTLKGIDWGLMVPGARIILGDALVLEISGFTTPCRTIAASFIDGRFVRISEKLYPGWSRVYARVLSEGRVRLEDPVEIIPPPE
jgi:MOSC domain-containing protein YiiM